MNTTTATEPAADAAVAEEMKTERSQPQEYRGQHTSLADGGGLAFKNFDELWAACQRVSKSSAVPKECRNNPEECFARAEFGMGLGFKFMQALQCIYVVNGHPAVWGDGMLGLCQSKSCFDHGAFHEWYTGTPYEDDYTAHTRCRRVGCTEPVEYSYSVADARRAKLWGKTGRDGQPTPWVTNPKRQLKFRARSFALRGTYADILMGLYSGEEMADVDALLEKMTLPGEAEAPQGVKGVEKTLRKPRSVPTPPPPSPNETTTTGQPPPKKPPATAEPKLPTDMLVTAVGCYRKTLDDEAVDLAMAHHSVTVKTLASADVVQLNLILDELRAEAKTRAAAKDKPKKPTTPEPDTRPNLTLTPEP